MKETLNIFAALPNGGRIDLGSLAGSDETAMFVYDIAPGHSSCPYHYEYVEEWLLVVSGQATVRTPDGDRTVAAGEIVRFPSGPAGAHKISNHGEVSCRTLLFSAARAPAVSVYPDSDKIAVWPGDDDGDLIFVRETAVPWSHGEDGWDRA
jgi:uncharacterized cupin superfamily protein